MNSDWKISKELLWMLSVAIATLGCVAAPRPQAYEATLQRTTGGIPNISAHDFGSLGFGTGYAAAQDHACYLARNVLRMRGEQAASFGDVSRVFDRANHYAYVSDDLGIRLLAKLGEFTSDRPGGIDPEMTALLDGYSAGFNRYIRDIGGPDGLTDPDCKGAKWFPLMTGEDVLRSSAFSLGLHGLLHLFVIGPTGPARPPTSTSSSIPQTRSSNVDGIDSTHAEAGAAIAARNERLEQLAGRIGSNAFAIGGELTQGGGVLMANPHIGWSDQLRVSAVHQVIPNVLNVIGAHMIERPYVGLFGNNEHVAWSRPLSANISSVVYQMTLVPGDPTAYVFDGRRYSMDQHPISVQVLGDDGVAVERTEIFYTTHFGAIMTPLFPWTDTHASAFVLRPGSMLELEGGVLNTFYRSRDIHSMFSAIDRHAPLGILNLVGADSDGNAGFINSVPFNVSDDQLDDCALSRTRHLVVLDGTTSDCQLRADEDSVRRGLAGSSDVPRLVRTDYVLNSNDDYWLTNPREPLLPGRYSAVLGGAAGTQRSLRTRSGLRMIAERIAGTDGLAGTLFDLDNAVSLNLGNRNYAGQIFRDDLVAICRSHPSVILAPNAPDEEKVDLREACSVLAAWDLTSEMESRGSHIMREFMKRATEPGAGRLSSALDYRVPFDVDDPIHTPRGLKDDDPVALRLLGEAVSELNDRRIPLDARLGAIQGVHLPSGEQIGFHGGSSAEGVFNSTHSPLTAPGKGFGPLEDAGGACWLQVTTWNDGAVATRGLLTYSISTDESSPRYSNMLPLYVGKELIDLPFTRGEVDATAIETVFLTEGTADCDGGGWQEIGFQRRKTCVDHYIDVAENRIRDFVD